MVFKTVWTLWFQLQSGPTCRFPVKKEKRICVWECRAGQNEAGLKFAVLIICISLRFIRENRGFRWPLKMSLLVSTRVHQIFKKWEGIVQGINWSPSMARWRQIEFLVIMLSLKFVFFYVCMHLFIYLMTQNVSLFSEMRSLEMGLTFELSFLDTVPATAKTNAFFKHV